MPLAYNSSHASSQMSYHFSDEDEEDPFETTPVRGENPYMKAKTKQLYKK